VSVFCVQYSVVRVATTNATEVRSAARPSHREISAPNCISKELLRTRGLLCRGGIEERGSWNDESERRRCEECRSLHPLQTPLRTWHKRHPARWPWNARLSPHAQPVLETALREPLNLEPSFGWAEVVEHHLHDRPVRVLIRVDHVSLPITADDIVAVNDATDGTR